jgi:hypothetical protein
MCHGRPVCTAVLHALLLARCRSHTYVTFHGICLSIVDVSLLNHAHCCTFLGFRLACRILLAVKQACMCLFGCLKGQWILIGPNGHLGFLHRSFSFQL